MPPSNPTGSTQAMAAEPVAKRARTEEGSVKWRKPRTATDEDIATVREVLHKIFEHKDRKKLCLPHWIGRFNTTNQSLPCVGLIVNRIMRAGILTHEQWKNFVRAARTLFNGESIGKVGGHPAPFLPYGSHVYIVRQDIAPDLKW